jgi:biotin carboxylase
LKVKEIICVLPVGLWQRELIIKVKGMGYDILGLDFSNTAICKDECDIFKQIDILDKNKVLKICQKYNIKAIVTDQTDLSVPIVSYVSRKMQFNNISEKSAKIFTNKYLMREFCNNNNFTTPSYKLISTKNEALDFIKDVELPVVLKPIDSKSSQGVSIVKNVIDLGVAIDEAFKYSKNKNVLIEKYIGGIEVTAEGYKTKNKHYTLATSYKEKMNYNETIAKKLIYINSSNHVPFKKLRDLNNALIEKMGLEYGITHAEYKYYNEKFYLIEVAARGGGTNISSIIVPTVSNIDILQLYLDDTINGLLDMKLEFFNSNCVILGFFDFDNGKVSQINTKQEFLNASNGILDYKLEFKEGDIINEAKDDRSRSGYYIIKAKSINELALLEQKLLDSIDIEYA